VETNTVVRRRGLYVFYSVGSQTIARLLASHAGRALYLPGRFLVFISVRSTAILRLEGLGHLDGLDISGSGWE
jgi:hypothetical protein